MTDEKIVKKLRENGYEPFQYDADPDALNGYNQYCVYYPHSLRKQDKHVFHQIVEFVFVNEIEDFDEVAIIDALEEIGLFFDSADYGRLKKVTGGDIVNSLNLRFARPKKRKCVF